ncbi:MAG: SpoIVB peptidase [Defluviitaleaceae bacterium]|nr:SpoIVB peptidase [Defluviitaleaceae bacterium]
MEKINKITREQKMSTARKFLLIGFLVLIVSILLYWGFAMYNINYAAYPHSDIFTQDSVTATTVASKDAQSTETARKAVVPVGITAGVRFYTQGIMVLGIGDVIMADGGRVSPSSGKLAAGDIVTKVDGNTVENIEQMTYAINAANFAVTLEVMRNGQSKDVKITPAKADDGTAKIGCWVRDSTQGIGTITYYCPHTKCFGALGHGIMDVDTGKLLSVRCGHMLKSNIINIRRGEKGEPGELIGEINEKSILGDITKNTPLGLYGSINQNHPDLPRATFTIANHNEITRGPAKIFSNIEGGGIQSYDVFIESINQDPAADKGMVVRITDQALIKRTGGIVQGMSGSPITQGDKIIGAITHVFVQNPLRGYAIHIEKMLAQHK